MPAKDGPIDGGDLYVEKIKSSAKISVWRVLQGGPAGRLLGTVAEEAEHWRASMMIAGELHQQYFDSLDAAAAWLLSITPKKSGKRRPGGSR